MNDKIKTYCPYCGIELDITESAEIHKYNFLVRGNCCNCGNNFHWVFCECNRKNKQRTQFCQTI